MALGVGEEGAGGIGKAETSLKSFQDQLGYTTDEFSGFMGMWAEFRGDVAKDPLEDL